MSIRKGPSGDESLSVFALAAVPIILAGAHADVVVATDARFAGGAARPVVAAFAGTVPLANLGIAGCWVSNIVTGAVSVRFNAFTGGVAGGNQPIVVGELP
jgi:hypothetical protein